MRILFITTRIPGAAHRGDQLRSYQQLMRLSGRHKITLLALGPDADPRSVDADLAARCDNVIILRHSAFALAMHAIRSLWTRRPLQVEAYNAAHLHSALRDCLSDTAFDLIHVQLIRLGTLVERDLPVPCVLDLVDALSVNMLRRGAIDHHPRRWLARFEAQRMLPYERTMVDRVSAATISSAVDLKAIGERGNLHLVDNGVDLPRFPYVSSGRMPLELVFIGNLGYFPNVDGVTWFATQVLPQLVERFPGLRLNLVGARPSASLKRLALENCNVQLIGAVPDVHPYLTSATLAIAPLRAGSGQQLKVLEAMASGTPVVASSLAAAGTVAVDGIHLLTADGVDATSVAVSRLLNDRVLRGSLAHNARQLVDARYSWEHSAADLERVWFAAVKGQ
ncbi:MAG: glycosyltransferase [Burkholderiales bacterium]|nr:glycosyltransferase [Burkholderiales bacterium]